MKATIDFVKEVGAGDKARCLVKAVKIKSLEQIYIHSLYKDPP